MIRHSQTADICLLVEGSYPYVHGGVSSWVQDLITSQPQHTFSVVAIVTGREEARDTLYPRPDNLIDIRICSLSDMPKGNKKLNRHQKKTLLRIEKGIVSLITQAELPDLKEFTLLLNELRDARGGYALLNSPSAWKLMVDTYRKLMPQASFMDYFWSFRALLQGLYTILLFDIPPAKLYHTTCTGYAGLLGARCSVETGRPLVLTEHGIYTNERRIELLTTDWLYHITHLPNYTVNRTIPELRDLWMSIFANYSRICYEACSKIITLYKGNQLVQLADGAAAEKMEIIPNGIDVERFSSIRKSGKNKRPTIAFIGRVVPIKDVKTFIRACNVLKSTLPDLTAYIMGPTEEDPDYYKECSEMVDYLDLHDNVQFTGNVDIMDYLPEIDVIVLTSVSEAQPLVILEAGAAGIPAVATRVGACSEMILGQSNETPHLGAGGAVVPLSSPAETAKALHTLLTDREHYARCSQAIRERVRLYYNKKDQQQRYEALYESLLQAT